MIKETLNENPVFRNGIDLLIEHKSQKSVFLKAAEEFNELTVRLLQKVNKRDEKVDNSLILEEMVDAQMHLILLEKYFPKEQIDAMVALKTQKFLKSKKMVDLFNGV